jgi:putative transposase
VAAFIADQRTIFAVPHAVACRALNVSESWFYKWLGRAPTARRQRPERPAGQTKALSTASGGTYGAMPGSLA